MAGRLLGWMVGVLDNVDSVESSPDGRRQVHDIMVGLKGPRHHWSALKVHDSLAGIIGT